MFHYQNYDNCIESVSLLLWMVTERTMMDFDRFDLQQDEYRLEIYQDVIYVFKTPIELNSSFEK